MDDTGNSGAADSPGVNVSEEVDTWASLIYETIPEESKKKHAGLAHVWSRLVGEEIQKRAGENSKFIIIGGGGLLLYAPAMRKFKSGGLRQFGSGEDNNPADS